MTSSKRNSGTKINSLTNPGKDRHSSSEEKIILQDYIAVKDEVSKEDAESQYLDTTPKGRQLTGTKEQQSEQKTTSAVSNDRKEKAADGVTTVQKEAVAYSSHKKSQSQTR